MLLDYTQAMFGQAMRQAVLIHFFGMAMPQMAMQSEAGFANLITQLKDWISHGRLIAHAAPLCGNKSADHLISSKGIILSSAPNLEESRVFLQPTHQTLVGSRETAEPHSRAPTPPGAVLVRIHPILSL
jgi:hypothetical protein